MLQYTIRECRQEDPTEYQQLAEMWNDSSPNWPGGWNRGVPETAESVRYRLSRSERLAVVVAEYEGNIVGYGELAAFPDNKEAVTISLLNARTGHIGKGVGKLLLLSLINKTAALGYKLISGGTWAGNLRALPLYKKAGTFWVPDTAGYLKNYIPLVLSQPALRPFFDRYGWYGCLIRDLAASPDKIPWHGIDVFPYTFSAGGETIEAIVDHRCDGITALASPDLAVACYLGREDVPAGMDWPVYWEIENKHPERGPLTVSLSAVGPAGIAVNVNETVSVASRLTIERTVSVSAEARPAQHGRPLPAIITTVSAGGSDIALATGVKVAKPVSIEFYGHTLYGGQPAELAVRLKSNLDYPVTGELRFSPGPGLKIDRASAAFALEAQSWSSCPCNASMPEPGAVPLSIGLTGTAVRDGQQVSFTLPDHQAVLRQPPLGRAVASEEPEREVARIDSGALELAFDRRQGYVDVMCQNEFVNWMSAAVVGPPFRMREQQPKTLECRVEDHEGVAALTARIPPAAVPGVAVEQRFTMGGGPVIRADFRVINDGPAVSGLQLRFEFGFEGAGIWTVPLVSGTVRHQSGGWGQFPLVPTDLPQNPAEYAESWMAVELPTCVGGAIWSAAEELYFADHFSAVTLPVPPIDTGGAADLPPLYFVASPGSWAVVRHCYKTLCQPGSQKDAPHDGTRPIIQAALDGRPLIMTSGSSRPLLQLTNCRGVPVEGKLEAATDHRPLLEGEAAVIVRGQPVSRELDISFPDGEPRVEPIRVGLDLGPSQQQFVLPAVVWGRDGDCSTVAEGPGVWRTDNGQMTLRADAGFRGALRTLECNGVNQLHTSYPAPRALGWINPWHGGAYPFLFWFGDMILAQETFSARPTARTGATGLAWRGIETACDVAKKKHNWLRLETDFLTLPGSNITAIVCRAVNRSAAPMRFIGGISVWAAPGGQPDQITVRSEQVQPIHSRGWLPGAVERRPFTRRQGAGVPILTCGPWVAFANAAVGDALLLACAAPLTSIEVIMIERLAASAMIRAHWRLEPRESREFTVWLVHARTLEQALPYQALAELTEL